MRWWQRAAVQTYIPCTSWPVVITSVQSLRVRFALSTDKTSPFRNYIKHERDKFCRSKEPTKKCISLQEKIARQKIATALAKQQTNKTTTNKQKTQTNKNKQQQKPREWGAGFSPDCNCIPAFASSSPQSHGDHKQSCRGGGVGGGDGWTGHTVCLRAMVPFWH